MKTLKSTIVYQNPWSTFFEDEVESETGKKGIYGYGVRPDGVNAILTNEKGEILLIQQYRYPIKELSWEIPGGGIDDGENPDLAVVREIKEETGLEATIKKSDLGDFYALSSYSTEKGSNYWLTVTGDSTPNFEKSEDNESFTDWKWVSVTEALEMIDSGQISDVLTANTIQIFARKYSKEL